MKVATAAYPLDWFSDWAGYEDKMRLWVAEAAGQGADLLLFPEFGAMELASLAGPEDAADLHGSVRAVSQRLAASNALLSALAQEFGVYILGGSAPVEEGGKVMNRAPFFAPSGGMDYQDKQILTRFERDDWGLVGAAPLKVFDTTLGRIGVLICYDSEFPLLGRALIEAGVEVILVPSCTEALEGYWRVRIGAMARALEGQCVTVMASLVGARPEIYAVEENTGMGGVFGPPDMGFPATGVMAEGTLGQPGWSYAEIDLDQIRAVRADGHVLNKTHWDEQCVRSEKPVSILL
ncbi:(R)-stereoselective amidase [Thalassovita gelatinovora]|uniref:(R)-stereoselective amidase n=1 Tax=Thalassovita gelatinovora TaxID=53501 RepID=A0A0N7LUM7_THAGE|nr:carbon-nitrogen hydrolase family protein [Thalassovita gelatinovora]QIZ80142.1 carbon-nitrogen hydrolase family protein [Thalassovita gelatinovora]CUH63930.1 (R)-stereoselective amidase [Thalassovita gelatinovora]SEQ80246.1 Predicted amidohydrolase [Thalassovita gelatinovora]